MRRRRLKLTEQPRVQRLGEIEQVAQRGVTHQGQRRGKRRRAAELIEPSDQLAQQFENLLRTNVVKIKERRTSLNLNPAEQVLQLGQRIDVTRITWVAAGQRDLDRSQWRAVEAGAGGDLNAVDVEVSVDCRAENASEICGRKLGDLDPAVVGHGSRIGQVHGQMAVDVHAVVIGNRRVGCQMNAQEPDRAGDIGIRQIGGNVERDLRRGVLDDEEPILIGNARIELQPDGELEFRGDLEMPNWPRRRESARRRPSRNRDAGCR